MAERKRGGPLEGVRVVELTKVWAGPYAGKLLAYLGAEVIKVESLGALDVTRAFGISDKNKAPGFQSVNPQKLSVQIDVKTAEGTRLMLDLLRTADIFIENLRPHAVKRSGLGYDAVRAVNPGIIFVSMGMYGSDGPLSGQTGYAPAFAALGGLSARIGQAGGPPRGMNVRYADSTCGTAAAFAAVTALIHRRRTGEGQFVDVSHVECMSSMIGDTLVQFALEGAVPACGGNRHPSMAPHGVYRCLDDEWLSLAVSSDEAWHALARAMEMPELAERPQFRTLADRKRNEDALDELIGGWTARGAAGELAETLQRHGVAAAKSAPSVDLVADAQLWERGLFVPVTDADGTTKPTVGPSWKMSRPAAVTDAAPKLGQHNSYVLGEILGLSAPEQQRLAVAGVTR